MKTWKLKIEAAGLTQRDAMVHAILLAREMGESKHTRGYVRGSESGNATGNLEEGPEVEGGIKEYPQQHSPLINNQWRSWTEVEVQSAVDATCDCGGRGPNKNGCCQACEVFHRLKGVWIESKTATKDSCKTCGCWTERGPRIGFCELIEKPTSESFKCQYFTKA